MSTSKDFFIKPSLRFEFVHVQYTTHVGKENPESDKSSIFGSESCMWTVNSFLTLPKVSKYVLGTPENIFIRKKHFLNKIWSNLAIFSFRIQDSRNCSKSWILKDFLEIEKTSKRSSYRPVDHFLRSSMLPKVFTTIPGQVPKQLEAMAIHILEASGSSLTHTYKQN